jgi:uncharacterized protein
MVQSSTSHQSTAQPTPEAQRIASIDMLRGFAVLGILLMNIQAFAMAGQLRWYPTSLGPLTGANLTIWLFSRLFADEKFIAILSMLFGAGILMTTAHVEDAGKPSTVLHYRRMGWLILFGLAHAYLVFSADILVSYALCGMLVYPLRKLRPRTLLILGVCLYLLSCVLFVAAAFYGPLQTFNGWVTDQFHPIYNADRETALYRGNWIGQMQVRIPDALIVQTVDFVTIYLWRISGLMLAGMALMKWHVFEGRLLPHQYLNMMRKAWVIGLPLTVVSLLTILVPDWSYIWLNYAGFTINTFAAPIVSFGWIGVVMLLSSKESFQPFTLRLAAVGRMALTNYLMQSIICMFVFYGNGLGLFGRIDRTGQLAIVLAIWIVQRSLSPVWLQYFHFGPAEWLWRSLTYLQFEPFRKK